MLYGVVVNGFAALEECRRWVMLSDGVASRNTTAVEWQAN
jgi:hypothetical protein